MADEDKTTRDEDVDAHKMHRADTKTDATTERMDDEPDVEGHKLDPGRHEPGRHEPGRHEPGRHEPGRQDT
jgi:hypothetical protein